MLSFLLRRAAHLAMIATTVVLVTFAASEWAPGRDDDPLRLEPGYSADAAAALRVRHGLDRPASEQLLRWLGSAARGRFGTSIEYEAAVAPLVVSRAGRTLLLGATSVSIAWAIGLPLGVWMAARPGSRLDRGCRAVLAVLLAFPEPFLALALMVVAVQTGVLPAGGMLSTRQAAQGSALTASADVGRHLALPSLVLALGLLPVLARHVRSSVASALDSPFIVAARARGVPPARLFFRSALRAAAPPLVSLFGLSIAGLLSASLPVEVVTGWPGLGPLLVEATRSRDIPLVAGASLCSVALLSAGTAAADLAARLADPRIRGGR